MKKALGIGLTRNQKNGLLMIAVSFLIWILRPLSNCEWYQLGCRSGSLLITPIFLTLSIIVLVMGIKKFTKK